MTTVLMVDEKWSVEFDPESNDRPIYWLRHGERHSPFNDHNAITALFYALSEARSDLAAVQPAAIREAALRDAAELCDRYPYVEGVKTAILALIGEKK